MGDLITRLAVELLMCIIGRRYRRETRVEPSGIAHYRRSSALVASTTVFRKKVVWGVRLQLVLAVQPL